MSKEVTAIFTMEVTIVGTMEDNEIKMMCKLANSPSFQQIIKDYAKTKTGADDVQFRFQLFEHSEGDSN